jgi:PII-like signaling protein/predicted transcriptional regulator
MQIIGKAKKVTVFIGESDRWGHKPLHMAILEMLRKENCAGATVTRALAGFGAHSKIRTTSLVALSNDLPLVVEWIDNPARVTRVLPILQEMVAEGLITVQDVDVAFYSHRGLHHLSAFVPVQDIMSYNPFVATPEMPVAAAVKFLLDKAQKALPVVDTAEHVIGILTDGDLLRRTGLLNLSAQRHLSQQEFESELQRLRSTQQTVGEIMHPNPITVTDDATIPQVVDIMLAENIKRVPVVGSDERLIGMVSRVDVLRAFVQPLTVETPRQRPHSGRNPRVADIMVRNVPSGLYNCPTIGDCFPAC